MDNLIGKSLGRYHILEQLGEGGMAIVFKAYDTRLETDVAVKVIRTENLPQSGIERALKRFEREAKALARLTHPNIVPIIDYGEYENKPYLVMKYLPGGTLKARLGGKPIPWQEAARLLVPVARALDYAHRQGMIHRDVKPSNVLITSDGEPMLTDFGIAKIIDEEATVELTGTNTSVGTPEYMAPEQVTARTVDARADIYALGVVFYEMVTGRKPFTADTPMAVLFKHASEPLPRPRQFVPGLPDAVEKVLLKALAKKPEDRYQSMGEFATALEKVASGSLSILDGKKEEGKSKKQEAAKMDPEHTKDQPVPLPPARPAPVKEAAREKTQPAFSWKRWLPIGIVLVILGIAIPIGIGLFNLGIKGAGPLNGLATRTATPTITPSYTPTFTFTPTITLTPTATFTPTPWIGSTWTRPSDQMVMVYVPEGTFTMGDTADQALAECKKFYSGCSASWFTSETPPHQVTLDAFWVDKTEVSNAMYALCVTAGACKPPSQYSSHTRSSYYSDPQYADYPVIYVDWNSADAYCKWAGGRLPTEAEWEKAARGTDGRYYPWGNNAPTCDLANLSPYSGSACVGDTKAVGSYLSGASPYGALDMAGNVWEWVADWYSDTYYASSPASNPNGPSSGQYRVLRGGSWDGIVNLVRSALRFTSARPVTRTAASGFVAPAHFHKFCDSGFWNSDILNRGSGGLCPPAVKICQNDIMACTT